MVTSPLVVAEGRYVNGMKEKEGDVRRVAQGRGFICRCELMAGAWDEPCVVWPPYLYLGCLGMGCWMEVAMPAHPEAGCILPSAHRMRALYKNVLRFCDV